MNKVKKICLFVLCVILAVQVVPVTSVKADSTEKVTVGTFAKKLEKVIGTEGSLQKEKDAIGADAYLTWKDAAILLNRADVIKNGKSYNEDLYTQVKDKKRLVGLKGLTSSEMKAVRVCFVKGILIGESMGKYSQARKFYPNNSLTKADVTTLVNRFEYKTKRIKLTSDGQVTRTTNLPKNYKKYSYILASFPNEFYEMKFRYQRGKYSHKPVNLKDYAAPKDTSKINYNTGYEIIKFTDMYDKYGEKWMEKIKKNLETRLNFNYISSGDKWIDILQNTYYIYGDADTDKKVRNQIKSYVNKAKKNHVTIKSANIVVEPSTIYKTSGVFFVRCYVKFKVTADNIYTIQENRQNELIYSELSNIYLLNLKNNRWYEGYYDIAIGGTSYGDDGEKFSVAHDMLVDYKE